jgi:hypothetical protein
MGDEDRGNELPPRVPGAPRAGPLPADSPPALLLSVELRQRLEAAVTAERSAAAAREQDRPTGGEVTTPSVRTGISLDQPGRAAEAGRAAEPGRGAQPARTPNAGPVAEDEVTEWLETAGRLPSAAPTATGAEAPPGAGPSHVGPRPEAGRPGASEPRSAAAEPDQPGSAGWLGAGIAALIVIPALVIGSLAVVAVRHLTGPSPGSSASAASARQEVAVLGEAAAWIAQQVGPGVAVSCDRVMCAALEARGLPARDLLVLGPLSPDPRHTEIVVETAAVRTLFGISLDQAWAPAVLASFGSGSAGITVRVVASHGAVAYQTALASDLAASKAVGARLLADQRISVAATARAQLTAGLVDLRLLSALSALSRHLPVSLVGFGNVGPGASARVPLRFADLSQASQAAGLTQAAYVRSVRAYLSGFDTRFGPVRTVPVVLPDGQAALRVEFTAPSPLGESGTPGSL